MELELFTIRRGVATIFTSDWQQGPAALVWSTANWAKSPRGVDADGMLIGWWREPMSIKHMEINAIYPSVSEFVSQR